MNSRNKLLFKCLQFVQCVTKFILKFIGGVDDRIEQKISIVLTVDRNHTAMVTLYIGYESFLI